MLGRGRLTVLGMATVAALALPASADAATVALWHMDETGGATMHDSAGSNDGTLHQVTLGDSGFAGTAYGFDGAHSYVSVPSDASLNPGTSAMSFTVHVRYTVTPPSGGTSDYDILRKGVSGTKGGFYKLEIRPDNKPICRFVGPSGDVRVHAGPALNDGAWHTITCARTSTTVTLTVDGTSFKTTHASGKISNSSALIVGAKPGSDYYNGDLDEVSVVIG